MSEIILKVIGGLGIFLLGMKNMSEGMQAVAGSKLRKMIAAVTDNRITACGVGTFVTCMIQSSSVTTVMVVGFVSAGFMTLTQAIGVIMGANIGTTITGWILVLNIGKYGLPTLGIAAFFFLFSKNERIRYIGMAVMGVGMVFFGLELMSSGLKPIRDMPAFTTWFSKFTADNYFGVWKCVLAGCALTCIVQSSSATLGITMGLAMNGIIGFPTAAALVLGENIGTTITAYLASLGRPTEARRAAYSHIIFNVLGVLWITALFQPYMLLVEKVIGIFPGTAVPVDGVETFPYVRGGIALVHSGFNIANTLLFLPFVPLLAKIVTRIVPATKAKEAPHLTFLEVRMLDTPAIGIQQSFVEILRMGDHVEKMSAYLKDILTSTEIDDDKVKKTFHREEILDIVQKEITEFLANLLSGNIPHDVIATARSQLRIADEYESVSDYLASVLKLHLRLRNENLSHCDEDKEDVIRMHDSVDEYIKMINAAVRTGTGDIITKAHSQGDEITHMMKEARARHLDRVEKTSISALCSLACSDMLTAYRRIKDHMLNIAEVLSGEK